MHRKMLYMVTVMVIGLLVPLTIYSTNACNTCQDKTQCNNKSQLCANRSDSAGLTYWKIKNETNHRTIVVVSDKETVHIEPGETREVSRTKSFTFTVGYPEKYGNGKKIQTFTIEDHSLGVYSRYFGKKSELQFLIGIAKEKAAPTKNKQ